MLHRNSSDSNFSSVKGLDLIKHKTRNLRAKLKNLLSSDSCNKYCKRSKQVMKMQQLENQQFYLTNTFFNKTKHLFTHTKQQPKQFWYCQKNKCNAMHIFAKLTPQEIQEISQDMIYYIGEDHVKQFKEFMQTKRTARIINKQNLDRERRLKTSNQNLLSTQRNRRSQQHSAQIKGSNITDLPSLTKNCSIADNFFAIRSSVQSEQPIQETSNKRLKSSNIIESRLSRITKRSTQKQRLKFPANFLGNRQNFLKNRKIIEQEQNAQRFMTKVNLEIKQHKAIDIFKTTQESFMSAIKQKNTNNDFRTKQILQDKQKKNVTFGSIVELNEELRKIYIKKISENPAEAISKIPQQKNSDKKKLETTLSNFFTSTNPNYKSKY